MKTLVPVNRDDLPVAFYDGKPGTYYCTCHQCTQKFIGDKRDISCPRCSNLTRVIYSALYADGRWCVFDQRGTELERPKDWPAIINVKFLRDRGITDITDYHTISSDMYTVEDWRYEVQNEDTCLGYEEWRQHRMEAERVVKII